MHFVCNKDNSEGYNNSYVFVCMLYSNSIVSSFSCDHKLLKLK